MVVACDFSYVRFDRGGGFMLWTVSGMEEEDFDEIFFPDFLLAFCALLEDEHLSVGMVLPPGEVSNGCGPS